MSPCQPTDLRPCLYNRSSIVKTIFCRRSAREPVGEKRGRKDRENSCFCHNDGSDVTIKRWVISPATWRGGYYNCYKCPRITTPGTVKVVAEIKATEGKSRVRNDPEGTVRACAVVTAHFAPKLSSRTCDDDVRTSRVSRRVLIVWGFASSRPGKKCSYV